jgi:hypothetical protein
VTLNQVVQLEPLPYSATHKHALTNQPTGGEIKLLSLKSNVNILLLQDNLTIAVSLLSRVAIELCSAWAERVVHEPAIHAVGIGSWLHVEESQDVVIRAQHSFRVFEEQWRGINVCCYVSERSSAQLTERSILLTFPPSAAARPLAQRSDCHRA